MGAFPFSRLKIERNSTRFSPGWSPLRSVTSSHLGLFKFNPFGVGPFSIFSNDAELSKIGRNFRRQKHGPTPKGLNLNSPRCNLGKIGLISIFGVNVLTVKMGMRPILVARRLDWACEVQHKNQSVGLRSSVQSTRADHQCDILVSWNCRHIVNYRKF